MSDLKFSPNDVLSLLGLPTSERNSIYVDCPNCGKKKKLNIVLYGEKAHLCRCNVCEWTGNTITLYQKMTGVKKENAYEEIKKRLKTGDKPATLPQEYRKEKHLTSSMASIITRSQTFLSFLKRLHLEEADMGDLLRRGLSKDFISKKGYVTLYLPTYEDARAITKDIEKAGCQLKGVQGFYKHEKHWTCVRVKHKGYTVPYIDRHALIQGFQIRKRDLCVIFLNLKGEIIAKDFCYKNGSATPPKAPYESNLEFVSWSADLTCIKKNFIVYPIYKRKIDNVVVNKPPVIHEKVRKLMEDYDDNRYYWFSSKDYEEGVGSPCFVHYATEFAYNFQSKKYSAMLSDTLYITEGALKGDIFHYYTKLPCLAISGVNCQEELMKELEAYKKVVKNVVVAFDMDYLNNQYVKKAEENLKEKIMKMGYTYFRLTWDVNYKGIDDFCLSNNGRFKINYTTEKSVLTCISKK